MNNQKRINKLANEIYKNEFIDSVENVRGLAKDIIKWLEEQMEYVNNNDTIDQEEKEGLKELSDELTSRIKKEFKDTDYIKLIENAMCGFYVVNQENLLEELEEEIKK